MMHDLLYALRVLRTKPTFALVTIGTLGLAIGINTAIFGFVDATLLKALPYRDVHELVVLKGVSRARTVSSTLRNLLEWREHSQVFTSVGGEAWMTEELNLTSDWGIGATNIQALRTTTNYFDLLGVRSVSGRTFLADEDIPGKDDVALLTHRIWQRSFGADAAVVGRSIRLDGRKHTIIGVLPPGVWDRRAADVWLPLPISPATMGRATRMRIVARLKPGVTLEQARGDMTRVSFGTAPESGDASGKAMVRVDPLRDALVDAKTQRILLLLFGAVGFVLLIACANVTSLMVTRTVARRQEVAIRVSLGAGRWRLLRQFLTESLVLSALGGAVGLVLASWLIRIGTAMVFGVFLPEETDVGLDFRVATYALTLSLLTAVVFGLGAMGHLGNTDLVSKIQGQGLDQLARRDAPRRWTMRTLLVVAEVALAYILVIGAGLMIRSFGRLLAVDPGIRPQHVVTFRTKLGFERYPMASQVLAYQDELLRRIRSLPAVQTAAVANTLPFGRSVLFHFFALEAEGRDPLVGATVVLVSADYFSTLGVHLREGRVLSALDRPGTGGAAVVDASFVRRYLGGSSPLGRVLRSAAGDQAPYQIVGVVDAVHQSSLDRAEEPTVYLAMSQAPQQLLGNVGVGTRTFHFAVKTAGNPVRLFPLLQAVAFSVDREQPLAGLGTLEDALRSSVIRPRFRAVVFAGLAGVALALAMLGIYGVLHYSVMQRTKEIGIRMAVGGQARDVVQMVLRQGMAPVVFGIFLGALGALLLTRLLRSFLFEVAHHDAVTFAGVALVLVVSGIVACYIPARRAARVDPVTALRNE